jgi:arginine N-succinyltransferase
MMVIRPVERGDLAGLMQLAGKTGGGLTSLPADEKTLSARIERALQTWQGTLPKSEQGYVFVLEDTDTGTVAGICAIEVAVGLNDPWYNYRVGTMVHASKELNVYNALPTLFLCNDHTAPASCARCSSTRRGAKRATAICSPNRALCLWPPSAIALTKRWSPRCAA